MNRFDWIYVRDFKTGAPNTVKIEVYIDGTDKRPINLPFSVFKSNKFLSQVLEAAEKSDPGPGAKQPCPACGTHRKTFLRTWSERLFCGFCGAHLKMVDGKLEIISKIDS